MRGAEAVLACLREQDVDTVFGYPGGMILPLYDALYGQSEIRQILVTHEQNAAHAADGYARATGRVGVCIATSGPGATNLVTGIATAYMDSIPMVAITGQVDLSMLGRDAFQETDILDVTMPVTKHNYKVKNAADLVPTIREAFDLARSGRPGPVLIDVPRNLFFEEVAYTEQKRAEHQPGKPDADFIICAAEAATEIVNAERPLVIVGGGVISAGASAETVAFIEKYRLPAVHTLMGMGAVPSTHPQMLGFAGMHGEKAANYAIGAADLVIALGSRFADRQTGNLSKYTANRKFIHIDIDPAEIDKNVGSSIGLAGDMRVILNLLMRQEPKDDLAAWWQQIHTWQEKFDYDYHVDRLTVPWALNQVAQMTTGKPYAYATDVGQHQMWAAQYYACTQPRRFLTSGGLGTMGYGLPAAIGAKLARPDKEVVLITGDGSIMMNCQEFATIADNDIDVKGVIVHNSILGMVGQWQRLFYNHHYSASELKGKTDFVKLAAAMGVAGCRIETRAEFAEVLPRVLREKGARLIDVVVPEEADVVPMVPGGKRLDQMVLGGR